jgi:GTPase
LQVKRAYIDADLLEAGVRGETKMKHRARPFAIVAGGILVVAAALLAGRLSQPGSPTA